MDLKNTGMHKKMNMPLTKLKKHSIECSKKKINQIMKNGIKKIIIKDLKEEDIESSEPIKRCLHCEKVLIDRRTNVKFCDNYCRSYYYKKESREKNKLKSKKETYLKMIQQQTDINLLQLFGLIYK